MSKADPLKIANILDNNVRTLVESGVEKSKVLDIISKNQCYGKTLFNEDKFDEKAFETFAHEYNKKSRATLRKYNK